VLHKVEMEKLQDLPYLLHLVDLLLQVEVEVELEQEIQMQVLESEELARMDLVEVVEEVLVVEEDVLAVISVAVQVVGVHRHQVLVVVQVVPVV
jgi:hypothetical protein